MSPARTRAPVADPACANAVELARSAAAATARPGQVGEHLGTQVEADRIVTHFFACLDPGYRGWRWSVSVVRAARAKDVTVDESVLLPGSDALLAPDWLPWHERLRPGDLGIGDLLPTPKHDERLVPGSADVDDDTQSDLVMDLGLGRARVLSVNGRDAAVERWYESSSGPAAPIAEAAPAQCSTCGFYVPLAGALRSVFGVCANELAPDDGSVVSADHGCGAHSEAVVVTAEPEPIPEVEAEEDELAPGSVDEGGSEPLGHS